MRRVLFLILCLFIFFGSAYAQRMSDEQVVEYVKQAQAAGKSQKQMTAELLRRGVTREQVLRIKDKSGPEPQCRCVPGLSQRLPPARRPLPGRGRAMDALRPGLQGRRSPQR